MTTPTIHVSVVTPTYNRAHTLARVYCSLQSQSYSNFEWVVIDDGSNDSTDKLIAEWSTVSDFPIIYRYQSNMGKVHALKHAFDLARGELTLIADSDDTFDYNAIQVFVDNYAALEDDQRHLFSGVSCLCRYAETETIVGNQYPKSPMISNQIEIAYRYSVYGEKWGILRTDLLREYFKQLDQLTDVRFISENFFWYEMGLKYKTLFINEVLRTCYPVSPGGLSMPFVTERHPKGVYLANEKILLCTHKYYFMKPMKTATLFVQLVYAALKTGLNFRQMTFSKPPLYTFLVSVVYPIAAVVAMVRKRQYEKSIR